MKWPYIFEGITAMKAFYEKLQSLFTDVGDDMQEQKTRVDTLIQNTPQPSEVVDMRTGRDSQTYPVARDMVLGEIGKTEAAQAQINQDTAAQLADETQQREDADTNLDIKKADQAFVSSALANALYGGPKDFFYTLSALQSTYPQGTAGPILILENNHIYIWINTAWTDAGVYLPNPISDDSIGIDQTNFLTSGKNIFNPLTRTAGTYVDDSTGILVSNGLYDTSNYIKVKSGVAVHSTKCRKAALYNSAKGFYQGFDNPASTDLTVTPTQDGYLRVSFFTLYIATTQVEIGTTATSYEPYGIKPLLPLYLNARSILRDFLDEATQSAINSLYLAKHLSIGKNMINTSLDVFGYLDSDGTVESSAIYKTTTFIPVKNGQSYTVQPGLRKLLGYDTVLKAISSTFIDQILLTYTFTATWDGFVRITYYYTNNEQMEVGSSATAYEPFTLKVPPIASPLYGKTILNLGDSIAWGANNGGVGYADIIATNNGMTIYDYSLGGATIANVNNESVSGCIQTKLANFMSDHPGVIPDYILLEGGTNDILYSTLGAMTSGYADSWDLTTFCGGLESILKIIKDNFPTSKVVFVAVHNMSSRPADTQKTFHDTTVQILNKWSVSLVDLYREGSLNTWIDIMKTTYTDTGTHPNGTAYNLFYVPMITAKMKTL
ncbi:MAG: hypothetical protein K0R55_3221 [Sporomusa sp.]|jgi:lysophospholipase L1-like esterase|nr:hypothetical protein [Sporomusa sp.]